MLDPTLLSALGDILPPSAIVASAEATRAYECDGLTLFREQPLAVLLPENEAQVVGILRLCHAARLPVVARGAGTGLSGGATPHRKGIVLSLAKFKRILSIDPLSCSAVVQPGVRNLAISEAAAVHRLYYAPDPSSQIACTIGGNVAENSGGVHCLKYGLTVHNVRRVRAVLIDGDVVEFGGEALDAAGYDLLALITGSEGLLAVITEVTVKLTPMPQQATCVLASFDDLEKAGEAVAAIIGAGIIPAGLEMMDQLTIAAVEPKGAVTVDKEPFPTAALPEGGGYVIKKPDATGRWEVSTYVWQPSQIIVTEGDEVSLEFVGINGAEHPTTIVGYDKALVLKRGHVVRVELTADKVGTFPIVCAHHRPSMVGELIVMPKK